MRKLTWLLLAPALISVAGAEASTTALHAAPASSTVGQTVVFTATFTSSCAGTVTTHQFTIDGKVYKGVFHLSGQNGTDALSISTLTAGTHTVTYSWQQAPFCRGTASLHYTVAAAPPPSPSPSPAPAATPSPTSSPVALVAATAGSPSPLIAYLGIAFIVVALVSGVGLAVLSRRT